MVELKLPPFEYKLKKEDDKVLIFDVIRKKYVVLTPEEWVRQHFVHYMTGMLGYPKALIRIERGLSYNTLLKRSDIVLYNRQGTPWLIVECKSPDQEINQQTLHQVSVYNTNIRALYVVLTNGIRNICCKVDHDRKTLDILNDFPEFGS